MKKIIFSLVALFATSTTLLAVNSTQNPENTPQEEQTENVQAREKSGKEGKGRKDAMRMQRGRFNNPFEGIELSEEQQKKINELQQSLRPAQKENDDQELTEEQKKAQKAKARAMRENYRQNYLMGLKHILNHDQYVKFLENSYLQDNSMTDQRGGRQHPGGRDITKNPKRPDVKKAQ